MQELMSISHNASAAATTIWQKTYLLHTQAKMRFSWSPARAVAVGSKDANCATALMIISAGTSLFPVNRSKTARIWSEIATSPVRTCPSSGPATCLAKVHRPLCLPYHDTRMCDISTLSMRATLHKKVRQSVLHSNLPSQEVSTSSTACRHVQYMQTNTALQTCMQNIPWVLTWLPTPALA